MPYKIKDAVRHKFTKKQNNKRDWKTYEKGLRDAGDLTIWFCEEAIACWKPDKAEKKTKGGQRRYTDFAIETVHTLRLVYQKPLRQTEGFARSILRSLKLNDLDVPDHTTLSRRSKTVRLRKQKPESFRKSSVVIIDSTGLKVVGEKEWMHHKHGTKQRKVWRKLHLCIDADGEILSSTLTCHLTSDASQVKDLLQGIDGPIATVIGDGGYDHFVTYKALKAHQKRHGQQQEIRAMIPPNLGFQEKKETDPPQRLDNIRIIEDKGKLAWQTKVDYGRRSRVENTMHRYKALIGNKLRSKNFKSQITETKIAIQILNRMRQRGMPKATIPA